MSEADQAAAREQVGGRYAWYVLSVLVLVYMFNFIDRQIISILAEDIKRDLGVSDVEMGFLYGTAFAVFYALFGIPLGRLADNWVRTRLLALGLTLWSGMTALSGFATSFTGLAAARVGVGIGEASASPAAFSMLSDWFPKEKRATALAIYSSGLYIGGGVSLFIGAVVKQQWNEAFPGGGPMGLVGWQAAFLAVGIPGLLLALWVSTLREPVRGLADGMVTPPATNVWGKFWEDLTSVLPPLTLLHAAKYGRRALMVNVAALLGWTLFAVLMARVSGNTFGDKLQWGALCTGAYAVTTWAQGLRERDPATFALIWGTPSFLFLVVGFGTTAFVGYSLGFWAAPYAIRELGATPAVAGLILGGSGAAGGFLGVVMGGRLSDWAKGRHPAGRIAVASLAIVVPAPFVLLMFTTDSATMFYLYNIVPAVVGSMYVGIAAATSQDLVLPRMRGAATATYFIGTTLIGLGLGPYFTGKVSAVTGSLATGVMALFLVAPLSLFCIWQLWRRLPAAEASRVARAQAAGEVM
ncbi:MFS transporter [Sandaracinobacteroides saxicola]|uniref:MFS transporter n=2 Tax=Sandaracinobacteroides saxicola TaxID=2759707 RepID=A0A7G5IMT3_9SPHN|nr:MFS transporter [Sandaracinobacteroides saxicola]